MTQSVFTTEGQMALLAMSYQEAVRDWTSEDVNGVEAMLRHLRTQRPLPLDAQGACCQLAAYVEMWRLSQPPPDAE